MVTSGRPHVSMVEVRRQGVRGYLDGELLVPWKTDYRDMSVHGAWRLPNNTPIGIGIWKGRVQIFAAEVREVTGTGTFTRGAPAATSPQPLQTIDLLALVDPVKDRVMAGGDRSSKSNRWERCDGALVYVTDGRAGKIAPPVALRARSCEVEVEFERLSGDGQIHVDFPFEKTLGLILSVVLDAPMIRMTYLTKGPPWPVGKQLRRRVVVRLDRGANGAQDHVTVRVDGEMAFDWQGDLSKHVKTMINEPHPEFSDQPYTAIYSNGDSYKITAWTLRVFDGEATVLRDTPARPRSTLSPPALSAFCAEVAALPAEQQVARVVAKMKELNPGFDGTVDHRIKKGVVTDLNFPTVAVADISPVRAFTALKKLICEGEKTPGGSEKRKGLLVDLSPLRGLKLEELSCSRNNISDLAPLQGMPLISFECKNNSITDLGSLAGMPLLRLVIAANGISDLTPLKGMPLQDLLCQEPQVRDLSPLAGLPLVGLDINGTQVNDLSPLRGMQLERAWLERTRVNDLSPLAGMPLKSLKIDRPVRDLSPLRGMPLQQLVCVFVPARDTELLRSMKTLKTINSLAPAEFWKRVEAGEVPNPK